MEVSTAIISAYTAKSLIVRQLQYISVPALWCFGDASSRNLHSAETLIHCTCVIRSSCAGNDELVTVEDSTIVGNVLYIHPIRSPFQMNPCKGYKSKW